MSDIDKSIPTKETEESGTAVSGAQTEETSEMPDTDGEKVEAGTGDKASSERHTSAGKSQETGSKKVGDNPPGIDTDGTDTSPAASEHPAPYKKPGLVIGVTAKRGQRSADAESKPAGIVSDMKALWKRHTIICAIIFVLVLGGCAALVYNVNTSSYVTHDANPYRGYDTLAIVVGNQFASLGTYEDGNGRQQNTDGVVVKVEPDGTVNLPLVKAKPGYTFMGWSQGGVKTGDEIDVDPSTTEIKLTADRHGYTRLYALFADSAGNGYCSCGDYQAGAYKDVLKK